MESGTIVEAAYRLKPLPYSENYREGEHHHTGDDGESRYGACLGAGIGVIGGVTVKHNGADTNKYMPAQRRVPAFENVVIALPRRAEISETDMHVATAFGAKQKHKPPHHLADAGRKRRPHDTHI